MTSGYASRSGWHKDWNFYESDSFCSAWNCEDVYNSNSHNPCNCYTYLIIKKSGYNLIIRTLSILPLILALSLSPFLGLLSFNSISIHQAHASGRTYYVDNVAGNDSYDGLEQTHTTGTTGPFATIAHVNAMACGSGAGQLTGGDTRAPRKLRPDDFI